MSVEPGKPLTFATIAHSKGDLLVFGLPGNPVSSLVTFQLVVVPVLRKLAGALDPSLRRVRAYTSEPMPLDPARPEYHRVWLKWDDGRGALVAKSTGGQRSSRLLSMRSANALLLLPQGSGVVPAGSLCTALLIGHTLASHGDLHSSHSLPVPPPSPAGASAPGVGTGAFSLGGASAKPIIGVLTVSDRASRGIYEDVSGPLIVEVLKEYLATDCHYVCRMVADEIPDIEAALRAMIAAGAALVCTTGGTGPSARDVTPEAMARVCTKTYDGFGEAMRRASLDAGVPTAILSRQAAASAGATLVINLPGKPNAVRTCLDAVFPAVPYCIDLLGGPYLEGHSDKVKVFRPGAGCSRAGKT